MDEIKTTEKTTEKTTDQKPPVDEKTTTTTTDQPGTTKTEVDKKVEPSR